MPEVTKSSSYHHLNFLVFLILILLLLGDFWYN